MSIFLIFLGILIVLFGLKKDLGSCRNDGDRLRLGLFLIGLTVLSILVFICNQWLPTILTWVIWVVFFIGIVLMVRWIQNAQSQDEKQSAI